MKYLMDAVYLLALVLLGPKILYRRIVHGRYRDGWSQRLGRIRRRTDKPCIWIHAVSVGEVNATQTLIGQLQVAFPGHEVVLSSTTDTGMARATALYGKDLAVFYYPFDMSWIVRRAMDNLQPDLCLLMELELWPNLSAEAARRGIPIVILNGRISDRSFPRYKLVHSLVVPIFARASLVLAQTRQYAERFIALGCRPETVKVISSLKYDTAEITDSVAGTDVLARQLLVGDEPVWIAGGTGDGEEEILLRVYRQLRDERRFADLRLMIIPRKPERFDEVAEQIGKAGLAFERYSKIKTQNIGLTEKVPVILGDTMGDLRKFYCLSSGPVFVGRTLAPMGGSDMMEPAALGKCVLLGPHSFNFRQTVEALLEGNGAIEVPDEAGLLDAMRQCLADPAYARRIAANGRDTIRRNQGATGKTIDAIRPLVLQKR